MHLLPPAPHLCQACAVEHHPGDAHNAQSIYYQVRFQMLHGRRATWADAVAHCPPERRALWRRELERLGAWSEPEATAEASSAELVELARAREELQGARPVVDVRQPTVVELRAPGRERKARRKARGSPAASEGSRSEAEAGSEASNERKRHGGGSGERGEG